MKKLVNNNPVVRWLSKIFNFTLFQRFSRFPGSEQYWVQRYRSGKTSGAGSYDRFASYKADVLNQFVRRQQIKTVIEHGCGDGNQLRAAKYPRYLGLDISPDAIARCKSIFAQDDTKAFKLASAYAGEQAELALSLDVIYHLVEDAVYTAYMHRLFACATRFVIIYSTNTSQQGLIQGAHLRHRRFTDWVEQNQPQWELFQHLPSPFGPNDSAAKQFSADFYFYRRIPGQSD